MLPTPIYTNLPIRPPDEEGNAARVWQLGQPDDIPTSVWEANLACHLIHAPGSHPMWPWYAMCLIHLRGGPGLPEPHRQFVTATHEVLVAALNPEEPLPDLHDVRGCRMLEPIDQCVQVCLPTDAAALQMSGLIVRAVCAGVLVPDQDHRSRWADSLAKTSAHLREGGHRGS